MSKRLDKVQDDAALSEDVAKISHLKARVRSLQAKVRRLEPLVGDAAAARQLIRGIKSEPAAPPKWIARKRLKSYDHGTPIMMICDPHWGEIVRKEQVNGVNEYNIEIARRRMEGVFVRTVDLLENLLTSAKYPGIVTILGGDIVSGYLHELPASSALPLGKQVLDAVDHIAGGIDLLLKHFDQVFVPCVVGNHGRFSEKPKYKHASIDNFDYLVYQFLAQRFSGNDHVRFQIPEATQTTFAVHGHRYLLMHGNEFKGGGGITGPYMPWFRGLLRKRQQMDSIKDSFDTLVFAHWHQNFNNRKIIVGGTCKGFDELAMQRGYDYEPPQQPLWLNHPTKGITVDMPVFAEAT